MTDIKLRTSVVADINNFFEYQLDTEANYLAAFTAKDPTDKTAYPIARISTTVSAVLQTVHTKNINDGSILRILKVGTDCKSALSGLRYIQELLGHNSTKTTEIYTHVSTKNIQQIKSPFDDLQ